MEFFAPINEFRAANNRIAMEILARGTPPQAGLACGGVAGRQIPELLRLQAIGGELVAVEIADIGPVGMGMPAPRADRTFILAAGGERGLVKGGDRGAARCDKADCPAIGEGRGLAVGR